MTERTARLRELSVNLTPYISSERAEIVTLADNESFEASATMHRARVFHALLGRKTLYIGPGELIVGERGPAPKAVPTYPELCCHSLDDLTVLHDRPRVRYETSAEVREAYANKIIPYWAGRSMRDVIFSRMTEEWQAAYAAGVFTEFMEQRAPGHTVLDDKIYRMGMRDLRARIREALDALDWRTDPSAFDKQEQLKAMDLCADALVRFAVRHAALARSMAAHESDPVRAAELSAIAEICERVPDQAPRTFHEALQAYWFCHLGVITELNTWDSFCPGRLDQHLYPFYRRDIDNGSLTPEQARELLQCFWVKFNNQPAPPKVGVTAAESGTYTDFCNINLGGVRPDGSDGCNELTYLLLDVIDEMQLVQPSSNIQVSAKSPDRFLEAAGKVIREGRGQPSVFNADAVIAELLRQGKTLEDARCGGTSGCVEAGAFGKEAYILTGYFNLPKVLEITLHRGRDPRTGKQIGLRTADPLGMTSFDGLLDAFRTQVRHFADIKLKGNHVIERLYATRMPAPFLSLLIDDCIAKGMDYNAGGARYNTSYVQGVGLGTVTDSLSALRSFVFPDEADPVDGVEPAHRTLPIRDLLAALAADFKGYESLRQCLISRPPRYGNDDDRADRLMRTVFDIYVDAIDGRPNSRGGEYHVDMLPTTCHIYFGSVTGATPDGRRAGLPLSEGISPVQGADRNGPTAVIRSVAKLDHERTGGTLLNMKFSPSVLNGDGGLRRLTDLIRSYFRLGGHHIQFNVVTAETLREAKAHPEQYRGLIVRVAGYSDYFGDLTPALQDEIIARTEHEEL